MSLIIKSNVALQSVKKLSDRLSTIKPVIDFDFRTDNYLVNGSPKTISEVLDVSRSGGQGYLDTLGNYQVAPENIPAISVDPYDFRKGLYVERQSWNYFVNSTNPRDQTVSFNLPTTHIAMFTVSGSGSLEVYDSGSLIGIAKEDKVFCIYPGSAQKIHTLNVKVIGSLSHIQLELTNVVSAKQNRIETGTKGASDGIQVTKIKRNIIDAALPVFEGCIVVKVHYPRAVTEGYGSYGEMMPSVKTMPYFALLTDAKTGIFGAYQTNGHLGHLLRMKAVTTADRADLQTALPTNIYAMNFSSTECQAFVNGHRINELTYPTQPFRDIFLLDEGDAWGSGISADNLFLEQCLVYNRKLDKDEMTTITAHI